MGGLLKIVEKSIYIGLHLFLAIFFVQLFRGLYLEIIPWKYELDPPLIHFMESCGVYTLSLVFLFLANHYFVGLNTFRLGCLFSASIFYFQYVESLKMWELLWMLMNVHYPSTPILVYCVTVPILTGWVLNRVINPSPKATLYILKSIRFLLKNIGLRFRIGL